MKPTIYEFDIPMHPQAKQRHRTGKGFTYTPKPTKDAERTVQVYALAARVKPIDGPIRLGVQYRYEPPKSWSKKRREEAIRTTAWKATVPDLDNLTKLIKDALNGIAWRDDAQVVWEHAIKHYAASEGITVTITELEEE